MNDILAIYLILLKATQSLGCLGILDTASTRDHTATFMLCCV